MEVIEGIENINENYENVCLALGTFDGIHLGHKTVINGAIKKAEEIGGTSIVFTFSPHPLNIIRSSSGPKLINTKEEKIRLLEGLGVDKVIFANFTIEFSELHPSQFIRNILRDTLHVKELYVGFNYTFGKKGKGTTDYLQDINKECEINIHVVSPVKKEDEIISSTKIREYISNGNLKKAKELLGYNYSVSGKVIKGQRIGRKIGFPTANLRMVNKVYPPYGVYGVKLYIGSSPKTYYGIMNIGRNPTLKPDEHSLEVHIFNFNKNIYGEKIEIELLEFIREEKEFESKEELVNQIETDIKKWKENEKCH
ncbi:MAG: bifunctional riboflavin kinase/FAD synthetase [Fusobacteriota bacterium]